MLNLPNPSYESVLTIAGKILISISGYKCGFLLTDESKVMIAHKQFSATSDVSSSSVLNIRKNACD